MTEFLLLITGLLIGLIITKFWLEKKYLNSSDIYNKKLENETRLRIKAETELHTIKISNSNNKTDFESLASKIMQNNNKTFIQLANETFSKFSSEANKDFKQSKDAVGEMLKPLKESLTKHEDLVKELKESSSETFGSLKTYLQTLAESQKSLEKETGALVTALKAPKVRGRWGEIGLKRIVEFSGMSEYCDFEMQVHIKYDEKISRPDMIVNLPGRKRIAVDSKAPLNAYLEMLETENEDEKKKLLEKHSKAVAKHMRELSSKKYWSQFDETVDFVVLYIEVEPAFGAALSFNKNLLSEAVSNRIVFATPTTLIALLQTVAYSWNQHGATENALKIWKSSKEIYERLSIF